MDIKDKFGVPLEVGTFVVFVKNGNLFLSPVIEIRSTKLSVRIEYKWRKYDWKIHRHSWNVVEGWLDPNRVIAVVWDGKDINVDTIKAIGGIANEQKGSILSSNT